MRIVMFYHSLVSDWNHGNAHFLRGVVSGLIARGHSVAVCEQRNCWSIANLIQDHGDEPIAGFHKAYPALKSIRYELDTLDLDQCLDGADLVIVHEWNDHTLVHRIGKHRARSGGYKLLFHDTHHRTVTARAEMEAYDLSHYDGVLAFGKVIRDRYLREGWIQQAWTWHEAADTRVFYPRRNRIPERDIVWIGNWGDGERTKELYSYLIHPVKALGLTASVYGVRYPNYAIRSLAKSGIDYKGWIPNYEVPNVFAHSRVTVHIPRRPYVEALPGIPTIRVFEALASGIPLISAYWNDSEGLFTPGKDFLLANNPQEMKQHLHVVLNDRSMAAELAAHGLQTILNAHTCAHRVDELMAIGKELGLDIRSYADGVHCEKAYRYG